MDPEAPPPSEHQCSQGASAPVVRARQTAYPRIPNPRIHASSGRFRRPRWIAGGSRPIRDLVAYPLGYWALWALLVDLAEEEHAGQGAGAAERTIGRGLLIRGFRVQVPGGVLLYKCC